MIRSDTPLNVDLINECIEEMQPVENKVQLLKELTQKRVNQYNEEYLNKINDTVDKLYNYALNRNIGAMGMYVNRLSKLTLGISKLELSVYNYLKQIGEDNDTQQQKTKK